MKKVFILGIDGAFPEFIFGEWLNDLPNIKKLVESGVHAKLNSTIPPLSATAWTSITTGKHPADTGIFEYVYRKNYSYEDMHVITSANVREKTIWQIASENNLKSIVSYILLTWPIKPFDGILLSGPLTPSGETVDSVYPREIKEEIKKVFGKLPPIDVPNFRDLSKEQVAEEMQKLTEEQIEVMKYLMKNKEWDLFFAMIPGSDRMNHAFWKYMDEGHRKYDPESKFKNILKDYYLFLDKKLGEFLSMLDKDTTVIILSDHGIMRMHSRVNLTDWLIQEGYMVLKEPISEKKEFNFNLVNWSKTKAFAIGAYEGQIFINLKGREPNGIVEQEDSDNLVKELSEKLKAIRGDQGEVLDTKIFTKEEHFKGKLEKIAPDIIIYFDNLQYGCNTTLIGNETLWSLQTAKGSDDAGHSRQGIFIMKNGKSNNKSLGEISYLDVAPTILNELGLNIPEDMHGKLIG